MSFNEKIIKKESDSWLDIYNYIVIVLFYLLILVGFIFGIIDSGNNYYDEVTNEKVYGVLKFSTWIGAFIFWIGITILVSFGYLIINKLLISYLSDIKTIRNSLREDSLIENEDIDKIVFKKESFERNVSACDYRKWGK
ncbi:MAG: hypothetical protein WC152_04800 [Candidatus Izemoplasmatales bacterium]